MSEGYIRETKEFVNSAGVWGVNEFVVFFVFIFLVAVFLFMWLSRRDNIKMTDKFIEVSEKSTTAINNNTEAFKQSLFKNDETNRIVIQNSKKLDDIHSDIKSIKEGVKDG